MLGSASRGERERLLNVVLSEYRPRLRNMIEMRINPQIRARADASDVIQEAFVEAYKRLDQYLEQRPLPFALWLRRITEQKLVDLHRRHLGAAARDARREVSFCTQGGTSVHSEVLGAHLVAAVSSPSQRAARAELKTKLVEILDSLEPIDREIIAMRHFEQLSNADTARELGILASTASKRYVRALHRLADILEEVSVLRE